MLPIMILIKDRLCALKYVFSKATYRLSMGESHHFTVYQVEKRKKKSQKSRQNLMLCYTVKYIHSEVTYHLNVTECD